MWAAQHSSTSHISKSASYVQEKILCLGLSPALIAADLSINTQKSASLVDFQPLAQVTH